MLASARLTRSPRIQDLISLFTANANPGLRPKTVNFPVENLPIWETNRKQTVYWPFFEMFGRKNVCSFKRNVNRRPFSKRILTESRGAVDS